MEVGGKRRRLAGMNDEELAEATLTFVRMLEGGGPDVLYSIVRQMDIPTVYRMCRLNTAFRRFCHTYKDEGIWRALFLDWTGGEEEAQAFFSMIRPVLLEPTIYGESETAPNWLWIVLTWQMISQLEDILELGVPRYAYMLVPKELGRATLPPEADTVVFERVPIIDRSAQDDTLLTIELKHSQIGHLVLTSILKWTRHGANINNHYERRIVMGNYRQDETARIIYSLFQQGFAYVVIKPGNTSQQRMLEKYGPGDFSYVPRESWGIRSKVHAERNMGTHEHDSQRKKGLWDYQ